MLVKRIDLWESYKGTTIKKYCAIDTGKPLRMTEEHHSPIIRNPYKSGSSHEKKNIVLLLFIIVQQTAFIATSTRQTQTVFPSRLM